MCHYSPTQPSLQLTAEIPCVTWDGCFHTAQKQSGRDVSVGRMTMYDSVLEALPVCQSWLALLIPGISP